MDASQNAYDVTTPLLRQVPQSALDVVFGAAALVSPDLKLAIVGRTWDEFMARSGRGDLSRNAMVGSSILLFFRNDEQRRVFESLLHSMHSDELGVHNQVVDLGTKEKPFYVQLHVQGLWQDGVFAGYFIHCLDITREHQNRLALIEQNRDQLSGRELAEKAQQQVNQLQEKLRAATEEIAQRESQLKKMAEKMVRLEKSSKEALERAEKSVERSSRLQHELDKFKKQQTDNNSAIAEAAELRSQLETLQAELAARRDENSKLTGAVAAANETVDDLRRELDSLHELQNGQAEGANAAQSEISELKAKVKQLAESCELLETESAELSKALEQSKQETTQLKNTVAQLEEALESARGEASELKAALEQVQSKPAEVVKEVVTEVVTEVVKEVTVDPTAGEFLNYISQRACFLDKDGKVLCATGSFWKQVGAVAEQAVGQLFTEWLPADEAKTFKKWLKSHTEGWCQVTSRDGTSWKACPVMDSDGNWIGAEIEELPPVAAPAPAAQSQDGSMISFAPQLPSHMRTLSRELADEFSNLLTGVLGHASLAAAEQDGTTSREILEIEKSAREAAQLVRKLSALGGHGRHAHECDLLSTLQQYVKKMQPGFFGERPQAVLCEESCRVNADANSLRLVLDSISAHARENLANDGHVCYTLSYTESQAFISLSYDGVARYPAGWSDGQPPAVGQAGWDLIFAREVLRGMGGELDLTEDSGQAMLLITLPLARAAVAT